MTYRTQLGRTREKAKTEQVKRDTQLVAAKAGFVESLGMETRDDAELVPGGRGHFVAAVQDYAQQLFTEARSIEQLEHTGQGPPEITAAHVEEAKFVLMRRKRRQAKFSVWVVVARIGQILCSAGIGIGAASFDKTWGAVLTISVVLLISMFVLIERELTREL